MQRYFQQIKEAIRKGDWVLLLLCMVTTAYGCLIIASATAYLDSLRYIIMQIVGAVIGILLYALVSSINVEFIMEQRLWMVLFNMLFLALLIPFGETIGGNRSWVNLPILPFNIQVAEVCKITYILIMASIMTAYKERISSVKSVFTMAFHLLLLVGVNMVLSRDLGVSLIFVFIFIVMAYTGGVNYLWFIAAIVGVIVFFPFLWPLLGDYQQLRIMVLFDKSLDPTGTGPLWQANLSLQSLTGGGMTGQGLFNGHRTQNGALTGQHTDFIFSALGEELGFVGCVSVLILLGLIIARCVWVGMRSQDYTRRLICFGAAAALAFQTIINVGMCTGIGPVIGLTLPFISYGATSVVSLYAMLGLVSGVFARPAPASHELYIRPPLR
ncbi:MAG: FtsW/RodA/SpoVE family cell cycle protein [Oscillospiraceae bacterium]|nr:FtsW/RodA/SpoVE family cell cycle protein [Oscillospiraceae bacterium]